MGHATITTTITIAHITTTMGTAERQFMGMCLIGRPTGIERRAFMYAPTITLPTHQLVFPTVIGAAVIGVAVMAATNIGLFRPW